MKFKSHLYSQDFVRTASAKLIKDGGQKANWLRQVKAAKVCADCRVFSAAEIAAINLEIISKEKA